MLPKVTSGKDLTLDYLCEVCGDFSVGFHDGMEPVNSILNMWKSRIFFLGLNENSLKYTLDCFFEVE